MQRLKNIRFFCPASQLASIKFIIKTEFFEYLLQNLTPFLATKQMSEGENHE